MADVIALMLHGGIEAHGRPAQFYAAPATLRAARFFGGTNEMSGDVMGPEFAPALVLGPVDVVSIHLPPDARRVLPVGPDPACVDFRAEPSTRRRFHA